MIVALVVVAGGIAGCLDEEPIQASTTLAPSASEVVWKPSNFSWVQPTIAGLANPGSGDRAKKTLGYLWSQGVTKLVSLTERSLDHELVGSHGLTMTRLPIKDFTAPTQKQMWTFVKLAANHVERGEKLAVHCGAGMGRTGTMLAAHFVYEGMSAADAIAHVRELRPGSIETTSQEEAIAEFARSVATERPSKIQATP